MDAQSFWYSSGAAGGGGGGGDPGDPIGQSLRFRGAQRLTRTMTSNSGGTYTWSAWIKKTTLDTGDHQIFGTVSPLQFHHIRDNNFGWTQASVTSNETAQRRDPSAWYHRVDVSNGTTIRMFINGELVQTWNQDSVGVNTNVEHFIGGDSGRANEFFQGYLADIYFIDGQDLEPTAFGRPNADGVWVPVAYDGDADDYGANGFHLTFEDPDDLGADSAPVDADMAHSAANDFTPTDFNTDPVGIFSNQLFTAPSNAAIPVDPTDQVFNTDNAGFLQSDAFNGDNSTGALSDEGGGSWIQFRPENEITATTSVSIRCQTVQTIAVNGTDTTLSQTADSLQTVDISDQLTFPIDIETISIRGRNGNNPRLCTIIVDGTEITDNTGEDYDVMFDSPTQNTGTLNPVGTTWGTFSKGNLSFTTDDNGVSQAAYGTFPMQSGRWYWETNVGDRPLVGLTLNHLPNAQSATQTDNFAIAINGEHGRLFQNGTFTSYTTPFSNCNIGIAYDADNGNIWFSNNGTWLAGASIAEIEAGDTTNAAVTGAPEGLYTPFVGTETTTLMNHNYGQLPFLYDVPEGFERLQTQNMPEATIANGSDHFRALTGTGANILAIAQGTNTNGTNWNPDVNTGFTNGLWWIKDRDNSNQHQLVDSVRGGNLALTTPTIGAETAYDPPDGNSVAWCWNLGDATTEDDNSGSLASEVTVNAEAGFSIVEWTGSGGFDSIGHGLNARPGLVITKSREADHWIVGVDGVTTLSSGGAPGQWVNNESFVGTNWANGLILNSSNRSTTYTAASGINLSGNSMLAYVWTPIRGYSAFGSYTGNGSADGPFIYTGFRPAFILIKSTTQGWDWFIWDTTRDINNPSNQVLKPSSAQNETDASSPVQAIDILSNGFKPRGDNQVNQPGQTHVWVAFAENPFQEPVTAR